MADEFAFPREHPLLRSGRARLRLRGSLKPAIRESGIVVWLVFITLGMSLLLAARFGGVLADIRDPWVLVGLGTAGIFLSVCTVWLRLRLLDPWSKKPWISEEAYRDPRLFLYYLMSHYHSFTAEELQDLRCALGGARADVLERIRDRRRGAAAPHLAWLVNIGYKPLGFSSEGELYQLLGGRPDELRDAVNALIDTEGAVRSNMRANEDPSYFERDADKDDRLNRLKNDILVSRRRTFERPDLVWNAYCVLNSHGTYGTLVDVFRRLMALEPSDRRRFCDILKQSTRGLLVRLVEADLESLESLDSIQVRNKLRIFKKSTDIMVQTFVSALKYDRAEPVTVITAGYSNAVLRCLEAAKVEIRSVFVLDLRGGVHARAKRMVAELLNREIPAEMIDCRELKAQLNSQSIVVLGFEAVTPDLEFVDPDHTFRSFDERGDVPLYAVGEAWKVRTLGPEERVRYHRAIHLASGVPSAFSAQYRDRGSWLPRSSDAYGAIQGTRMHWQEEIGRPLQSSMPPGASNPPPGSEYAFYVLLRFSRQGNQAATNPRRQNSSRLRRSDPPSIPEYEDPVSSR